MNDIRIDALDAIPAVLEVARQGSATLAAASLGVSVATVLRRIERLEQELEVRLFDRSPTGLSGSPALELVLPWMQQIEDASGGMRRELLGLERHPSGTVRLATLQSVACRVLAPALPALRERYPELVLEIWPSAATVDLTRREADLALRLAPPLTGELVARRVVEFKHRVYVARHRWEQWSSLPPDELPWITWMEGQEALPDAAWLYRLVPRPKVVFRSSELETLLMAAAAGVGAVIMAEPLTRDPSLQLVALPITHASPPLGELWLVAHRAVRAVPRVAAVWEWVLELIAEAEVEP